MIKQEWWTQPRKHWQPLWKQWPEITSRFSPIVNGIRSFWLFVRQTQDVKQELFRDVMHVHTWVGQHWPKTLCREGLHNGFYCFIAYYPFSFWEEIPISLATEKVLYDTDWINQNISVPDTRVISPVNVKLMERLKVYSVTMFGGWWECPKLLLSSVLCCLDHSFPKPE